MANVLTDDNLVKSLNKWFVESYADSSVEIDFGNADQIDETRLDKWVYFSVDDIIDETQRVTDRASNRICQVYVSVTCYGKSNTNVHAALPAASAIRELLTHARIPVYDFDDDERPVIGLVKLNEAQAIKQTEADASSRVDVRAVTCEGKAERTDQCVPA